MHFGEWKYGFQFTCIPKFHISVLFFFFFSSPMGSDSVLAPIFCFTIHSCFFPHCLDMWFPLASSICTVARNCIYNLLQFSVIGFHHLRFIVLLHPHSRYIVLFLHHINCWLEFRVLEMRWEPLQLWHLQLSVLHQLPWFPQLGLLRSLPFCLKGQYLSLEDCQTLCNLRQAVVVHNPYLVEQSTVDMVGYILKWHPYNKLPWPLDSQHPLWHLQLLPQHQSQALSQSWVQNLVLILRRKSDLHKGGSFRSYQLVVLLKFIRYQCMNLSGLTFGKKLKAKSV